MPDARLIAAEILTCAQKDNSYSVLAVSENMKKIKFSDSRDKAFAVSLIYGVLEHKITLDYNISLYLNSGFNKIKLKVLNILRIGAYQILFTEKIPVSAAVNEAVKSAKKIGAAYAAGMINAVLRKIADNGLCYPNEKSELYSSVKYSVDKNIYDSIKNDYGEENAEKIFGVFFGRRPIFIRHNKMKCSEEQLVEQLENDGVHIEKTSLDGCFSITNTGDISHLSAYNEGMFYVQDMSSQLCCCLLAPVTGDTVLDCCAAPGGKSFTLSQYLNGKGKVYSCDIHEHKTKLIADGAKRLGIDNIEVICSDARELNKSFSDIDKVLCDVPCSGFGVIGRKPEIRYKNYEELSSLPEIQKEILFSCAKTVKKGGTLVYSTCTLHKKENEEVCDAFLREFPDFCISNDPVYRQLTDKYLTVFPTENQGDGFFVAKFERNS